MENIKNLSTVKSRAFPSSKITTIISVVISVALGALILTWVTAPLDHQLIATEDFIRDKTMAEEEAKLTALEDEALALTTGASTVSPAESLPSEAQIEALVMESTFDNWLILTALTLIVPIVVIIIAIAACLGDVYIDNFLDQKYLGPILASAIGICVVMAVITGFKVNVVTDPESPIYQEAASNLGTSFEQDLDTIHYQQGIITGYIAAVKSGNDEKAQMFLDLGGYELLSDKLTE